MVNICVIPIFRGVAGAAVCAESASMFIVVRMAGIAVRRCASILAVGMAILAGNFPVLAHQFEVCKIVVKLGRLPAFRRMTAFAVAAKPSIVLILFKMAGEAILRFSLHVRR